MNDFDLVEFIAATERLKAWAEATQYRGIAALARRRPAYANHDAGLRVGPSLPEGDPDDDVVVVSEFAADEVALALCITRNAAQIRAGHALDLTTRLPGTLTALAAGRIDGVRARAISDATGVLPTSTARAVQDRVLPTAGDKTPAALRRALARQVLLADPAAAAARHAKAAAERKVVHYPEPDGMATLAMTTLAWQSLACYNTLDADARSAKAAGDRRPMDALRADALVARVLGRCSNSQHTRLDASADPSADPSADTDAAAGANPELPPRSSRRGGRRRRRSAKYLIQVTVPISTLLGCSQEPGQLAGHGPLPADVVREIARDPDSVWHRLLTDPASGRLLDYGSTTYRPPEHLDRFVDTRDQDCRMPICGVPAHRADFNHSIPFHKGGPTADYNGGPACRHDHRLSQQPGWHLDQDPETAIFTWTTPSGHTYRAYPAQLHPPDTGAACPDGRDPGDPGLDGQDPIGEDPSGEDPSGEDPSGEDPAGPLAEDQDIPPF